MARLFLPFLYKINHHRILLFLCTLDTNLVIIYNFHFDCDYLILTDHLKETNLTFKNPHDEVLNSILRLIYINFS